MSKFSVSVLILLCIAVLTVCNPQQEEQEATSTTENNHSMHQSEGVQTIQPQAEPDTLKGSLKAEAHGQVGSAHITIAYHSPAVRGRMIWGGLVAHNQVWVTGAHSATSLQLDQPVTIGGQEIPAGKYALFTIPGEEEWTVIINKNWEQHLADDYSEAEDVVRFTVNPETTEQHQERLRYEIVSEAGNTAAIVITWDKLKATLPVKA